MPPTATISAVLLLFLVTTTTTSSSAPIMGLDSFLNQQSRVDPTATNDSFPSLPSSLKKHLSHPSIHHPPTPSSLLNLQLSVPITVKLVGTNFSSNAKSQLSSFLTSAITSDQFHVITPFSFQPSHHLTISHSLHLDVSLSPSSLSSRLNETLKTHLHTVPSSLSSRLYETVKTHLHTVPSYLSSRLNETLKTHLHTFSSHLYETLKTHLTVPSYLSSRLNETLTTHLHTVSSSLYPRLNETLKTHLHTVPSSLSSRLYETLKTHLHTVPSSLSSILNETLKTHLDPVPSSFRSVLASVPHGIIDEIIKQDYDKEKPIHGIYIYILNLGTQSKPYAYSYTTGDASLAFTKCLGTVWTGKERYLWIDLGAGPVDYGPGLSGDGVLPSGEFHPFATLHGRSKSQKALLSDLASLVWSAYQVLMVPPLRIPVPFENSLIVEFIHISGSLDNKDSFGLDWKSIERNFMDEVNENGLLFGDQSLRFKKYEVNLGECPICSFAISRAATSYTSRYLFDNYTLIVSEYLDSKRLHQTLSEAADEFRRVAKIPKEDFGGRILPVYVFDLDVSSILLLDRYHQSVAFKDMVIAVRTKSTQTVSDYSCTGRHVFTQTRELERPIIGSILQSMWGVSPTHLMWSPRHNSTLVDYTWSVGQTPFGPFSEVSSLSFVQKDAARRNVLLTSLNFSITSALEVLESISAHGGERKLLKHNQLTEFMQRWNLFKYKLDKAVSALSHFDYEMALYYMRASDHDIYAIHSIVYHASQELEASLVCFKDPPFPWASVSMTAGVLIFLLYVWVKRDKFFSNKRKQF